jgi:hypothetical protein
MLGLLLMTLWAWAEETSPHRYAPNAWGGWDVVFRKSRVSVRPHGVSGPHLVFRHHPSGQVTVRVSLGGRRTDLRLGRRDYQTRTPTSFQGGFRKSSDALEYHTVLVHWDGSFRLPPPVRLDRLDDGNIRFQIDLDLDGEPEVDGATRFGR